MTTLIYDEETDTLKATIDANTIEIDADVWTQTVKELTQTHYDNGMSWKKAHAQARRELLVAESWFSPQMPGVKINGQTYTDVFQAKVVEFVRDGLITREPVRGQGIAVKYIKEPLQTIALAELDKQGK